VAVFKYNPRAKTSIKAEHLIEPGFRWLNHYAVLEAIVGSIRLCNYSLNMALASLGDFSLCSRLHIENVSYITN